MPLYEEIEIEDMTYDAEKRIITTLLLLTAVACIGAAGRMHDGLLDQRQAYGLSKADPLENTPPIVADTVRPLVFFQITVDGNALRMSKELDLVRVRLEF